MTEETLYLAGPMRGKPMFNFNNFMAAESALIIGGYRVYNPARRDCLSGFNALGMEGTQEELDSQGFSWEDAMRSNLQDILHCTGIALLDGWEESKGAMIELVVAEGLRLDTFTMDEYEGLRPLHRPLTTIAPVTDEAWMKMDEITRGTILEMYDA